MKNENRTIYAGIGNSLPKWKLEYIRKNAADRTARQIAEAIGVSACLVYDYCALHHIELTKVVRKGHLHVPMPRVVIRDPQYAPKQKLVRPPAKYDNVSREEHVEKWLNTDI